jgi:formylglycine-generating enzyme required for sulfatase activity/mono/diheme cytochrome c family protein
MLMNIKLWLPLGLAVPTLVGAADKIDFALDIKPLLEANCLSCHGAEKPKGDLRLDTRAGAIQGGGDGAGLFPGDAKKSPMYASTILPADHDDLMPPSNKGGPLPKAQTDLLASWIQEGAVWPEGLTLKQTKRVDFVKDIQPLLELNCVACHREGHDKGNLRLDVKSEAFKGGDDGPAIVPRRPKQSPLYTTTILPADHDDLMPPANKGGPLPKDQTDLLLSWIEQGAIWPDGITLVPKKKEEIAGGNEEETIADIHKLITSRLKVTTEAEMKPYAMTIPGTQVTFAMVPIRSGEFTMGSPQNEAGRQADEGPLHKVKISPFWMGKTEVTWDEFELFMFADQERKFKGEIPTDPYVDKISDAVSRPTKPYVEMSFGMGKNGYPAISMTQHSANKYCEWLSAKTGEYYRLPTEAEWEYACRAGTTTRFSFGDDPVALTNYAWFEKNSDFKYQKVGTKLPNPWGLHDMHGNVLEWCLDQYQPTYQQFASATSPDPWVKSATPYPHSARGGGWDDSPDRLRSASRRFSDPSWKQQDPQLPKSIWYHTDAQFLGLRVVRPLKVPSTNELFKVWNSGVEKED